MVYNLRHMKLLVTDAIRSIKPYVPGKPIEELEREYGISNSIKLASNENPLGPSPMAVEAILKNLGRLNRYPDGSGHVLVRKLAEKFGVSSENVVIGNGSDDIISMLTQTFLNPGDEAILPKPSFLMYEIAVKTADAVPVAVPLKSLSIDLAGMRNLISARTRMIFLCNPNNPTGTIISADDLDDFLIRIPEHIVVVVDEAYIEFARDPRCLSAVRYVSNDRPVVALRTFSKAYGLAGIRVGYGIMAGETAGLLNRIRQPFNVNSLAQAGAAAALDDHAFFEKTVKLIHDGVDYLQSGLDKLGIPYFPTEANFFLVDVERKADAVFEDLLRMGVIVRSMTSYGYPNFIRVNAGLPEENDRLLDALRAVLK
jgi:histidinol-phosphate aminotransferase